jgi:hypothetical protein
MREQKLTGKALLIGWSIGIFAVLVTVGLRVFLKS